MPPKSRLSREEKETDIATIPSPTRYMTANENMSLSQRLLVADSHRQIREEAAGRIEISGYSGVSSSRNSGSNIGEDRSDALISAERDGSEVSSQARIARVDRESRLLCVPGPRKSRLSLFARKQQKILTKAREMEGVPDLSALLKGKLQLLSKKSSSAGASETARSDDVGASREKAPSLVDEDVGAEPSASSPKKKKRKKAKRNVTDQTLDENTLLEEAGREDNTGDPADTGSTEPVPEKRPKKKTKKKSVEAEKQPSADGTTSGDAAGRRSPSPETPSEKRRRVSASGSEPRSESSASERTAPDSVARRGARSEVRGDDTPDPWQDEGAIASRRSLFQGRVHQRCLHEEAERREHELLCREALRVKFEELEGKLKSDRASKKEAREKARQERATAALEKEKAELREEKDAAVGKLIKERQRLKDSRSLEVTRKRERVQAAMTDKADRYVKSAPTEQTAVSEEGSPEKGNALVREEGTEDVGPEDPVLVSDTSSEEREDEGP
ncbi:hypothetical protein DY000_02006330 [Brassica cretica]|uniref:INO80 complex subunit B-like conserved region domain-containing protein n=1 Tax=Brassica cretica TaxID=69181 RepID=A0ABQ7BUS8_BRACR|nr:hypothetical protein DY000_02006330 [Brassica cretica]